MNANPPLSAAAPPQRRLTSNLVIRACMVVVSIAMGLALYAQAGLVGWASALASIVLYVGLAGLNGEWRNAQVIASLNEEIARLEAQVLQRGAPPLPASAETAARTEPTPMMAANAAPAAPPAAGPRAAFPPLHAPARSPQASRPAATAMPPPVPTDFAAYDGPRLAAALPPHEAVGSVTGYHGDPRALAANDFAGHAGWNEPALDPRAAAPPAWSFRPAEQLSDAPPAFGRAIAADDEDGPPALPATSSIREADVAIIQGLIEKLAHEVNAAEAATPPRRPQAQQALSDSTIASSLEALRVTADAMRRTPELPGDPRLPLPQQPAAQQANTRWASPVTANGNHARLAALAEAITSRRVDLMLEPILGLQDHRPRYYTVHLRPRSASGASLGHDSLLQELRDTGLLPVLDCTRIARIAEVARRLADRGKAGAVFSEFSAESLGSDQFLADFAKAYHERDGFSDQLVLSFAQSDVRAFGPRDWTTIADMRDLGFRFALQSVTDLDMDFERVRDHGFDFITLDADVFLNGLPAPGGVVPVADLCRHLAGLGLTLIVSHIDDETKLARIFGFGALFGQGQLFGGPRLLKAEVARAAHAIAGAHAAA